MVRKATALSGTGVFILLAACGGSGGGPAGPTPPPGPPVTGTINSNTVLVISGRSTNAALDSGGFGNITDFVGLTAIATNNPANPGVSGTAKPARGYVLSQVPVGPEVSNCAVSGTVTVSGDIASPLTVTPGDFLDYDWDTCDDGIGTIIDGFIGMTFTDFDGDLLAGQILLGVSLDIQDFQVTNAGQSNSTNGDLTLTIDSRDQPITIIETIGTQLAITNGGGTDTLTSFSSMITEDNSVFPNHYTTDVSGTISSTLFQGTVSYDTDVPFESFGNNYPNAGEMVIFGSDNSRVRLIAISDTDVRIEADYDGDGANDAIIDTTWEALLES